MTAPLSGTPDLDPESRWCSPLVAHHFDTTINLRDDEVRAIGELGVRNLRRLQYHDPNAPGWHVIGRLLRPLETVNAALDSPATAHRRRAMADAVAVLLVRCAEKERTFWGWSTQEWVHLLGRDQAEFHRNAPRLGRRRGPPLPRRARLPAGLLHRVPPARQLPTPDPVVADLRARPSRRRDRPAS